MLPIDFIAFNHPWRLTPPGAKVTFLLLGLLLINLINGSVLFIVGIFTLIFGGYVAAIAPYLKWRILLGWYLSFMSFIIISSLMLPLSVTFINGLSITWQANQLPLALATGFRSLCGIQLVISYSLCTPMDDTIKILKRLKVPHLLLEMMGIGYRFIGVMLLEASQMHLAQRQRLGYSNNKVWLQSLSLVVMTLVSRVHIKAYHYHLAKQLRLGDDMNLEVQRDDAI